MKKILVTGGSGFLGSRIADHFRLSADVYAPDRRELDFTDGDAALRVLEEYRPDAVIHCGAISAVGVCEQQPELARKVNIEGAVHMARAAKAVGAKCIVCSSDQVYTGSPLRTPHRESEVLHPFNVYGQGKLEAEERCLRENPACVQLRLTWMYDSKTNAPGEHSDFLRILFGQLKRGETLRYPVHELRGLTDVNLVVRHMEKVLRLPGGVYNYGSPNEKNTWALMCDVLRGAGISSPVEPDEEAFRGTVRNLSMNVEKIESFGIHFPTVEESLVENCRRFCR